MEEQILMIIKTRINGYLSNPESRQKENAAKEITSMVMEFIKWLTMFNNGHSERIGSGWRLHKVPSDEPYKEYSLSEVYSYWFNNIRNK